MIKRGAKFRIAPYGVCVVQDYIESTEMYAMRLWNSDKIIYINKEKIEKSS